MSCIKYCDRDSEEYDPKLCKLCLYIHQLEEETPFPFPPDPDPTVSKIPNKVLGEIIFETIIRNDLDSSSTFLNTIKNAGILETVLKTQLREHEKAIEILQKKIVRLERVRK